jgi:hypothetical protein
MSITSELTKTIEDMKSSYESQKDFVELRNFYEEMNQKGLVVKKEYDMPLLDTVGRTIYRSNLDK